MEYLNEKISYLESRRKEILMAEFQDDIEYELERAWSNVDSTKNRENQIKFIDAKIEELKKNG